MVHKNKSNLHVEIGKVILKTANLSGQSFLLLIESTENHCKRDSFVHEIARMFLGLVFAARRTPKT